MLESQALNTDGVAGPIARIVMGPTGQGATFSWARPHRGGAGTYHSHIQDGTQPAVIVRSPQTS